MNSSFASAKLDKGFCPPALGAVKNPPDRGCRGFR